MTRPNLPWPSRAKLENEDPNLFLGLGPSFGALSAERRQAFFVAARRAHCRLVERDASFRAPPDEVSGFDATAWRTALRERARNPRKRSQESRDKDAASHAAARDRKKAVAAERDGHLKRLGHLVDPVWRSVAGQTLPSDDTRPGDLATLRKELDSILVSLRDSGHSAAAGDDDDDCTATVAYQIGVFNCAVLGWSAGGVDSAEQRAQGLLASVLGTKRRERWVFPADAEVRPLMPTDDGFSPNRALILPHLLGLLGFLARVATSKGWHLAYSTDSYSRRALYDSFSNIP